MELGSFLKILYRHKFTLIIIPLITVIITFFLVRNQPDSYTSQSQIATGLVDKSQQALNINASAQQSEISQDFDNLIEILHSKRMLDQVSYQLMIHDLTSTTPFRSPSKLLLQLNAAARAHALTIYTEYYKNRKQLSLFNADEKGLDKLIESMKYDDESLLKNFSIYRAQSSDFIDIEYNDNDPELTAFAVNTLTHEFVDYYNFIVKDNQVKAITLLGKLVTAKRDTVDSLTARLRNYKIRNHISNGPGQSEGVYKQISDLQAHLAQAQQEEIANDAAIKNIDAQFTTRDSRTLESMSAPVNRSIVNATERLRALNEKYVESNFDPSYKVRIDSLQRIINERIGQSSDAGTGSATSTQAALAAQRLTLKVAYDQAKNSIGIIQQQLAALNGQLNGIVPNEAAVQQYESSAEIAQKEYLDILAKYNQANYDSNYSGQLKQLETAMPGTLVPSKKMLLVILSGIISFIFCVVVFFILYFIDDTIKTPEELANKTGSPVLGYLNLLSSATIDLRKVWSEKKLNAETSQFRNLLQSIRFEVDSELGADKVLVINSLAGREGKTFLATNLAYAYSLVNKKVLLIDGNFANSGITKSVKSKIYLEDYLAGAAPDFISNSTSNISVLSNKGGDGSLFEISSQKNIEEKLEKFKKAFDIIIIEASSLNTLNKSKEWNMFSDKILTVFEAGKDIKAHEKKNISYLKNLDGKFLGWVLNVVNKHDAAEEDHTDDSAAE
jgi:uncharacterized protein involved in exopolysaccharide biosynthesis/Mrp family chromosome partitioning ATPase